MRLRSTAEQSIHINALDLEVHFEAGEEMLTEISAKSPPEQVADELIKADFVVDGQWGADEGDFLLTLAHPYC